MEITVSGYYASTRSFGPVEYRAVAIPADENGGAEEMNAFSIILAACPVLLLGVVAFFVLIVAGVRKGDRSDLASPPVTASTPSRAAWSAASAKTKRATANARDPSRDY